MLLIFAYSTEGNVWKAYSWLEADVEVFQSQATAIYSAKCSRGWSGGGLVRQSMTWAYSRGPTRVFLQQELLAL